MTNMCGCGSIIDKKGKAISYSIDGVCDTSRAVIFSVYSHKQCELAINMCSIYSEVKSGSWVLVPPERSTADPLAQRGYIGFKASGEPDSTMTADNIREITREWGLRNG